MTEVLFILCVYLSLNSVINRKNEPIHYIRNYVSLFVIKQHKVYKFFTVLIKYILIGLQYRKYDIEDFIFSILCLFYYFFLIFKMISVKQIFCILQTQISVIISWKATFWIKNTVHHTLVYSVTSYWIYWKLLGNNEI